MLDNPIVTYDKFHPVQDKQIENHISAFDSCKINPSVYLRFLNINNGVLNLKDSLYTSEKGLKFSNLNLTSKNIFHGEQLDHFEFLNLNS